MDKYDEDFRVRLDARDKSEDEEQGGTQDRAVGEWDARSADIDSRAIIESERRRRTEESNSAEPQKVCSTRTITPDDDETALKHTPPQETVTSMTELTSNMEVMLHREEEGQTSIESLPQATVAALLDHALGNRPEAVMAAVVEIPHADAF